MFSKENTLPVFDCPRARQVNRVSFSEIFAKGDHKTI